MARWPTTSPVVDVIERGGCKIFFLNNASAAKVEPRTAPDTRGSHLQTDDLGFLYKTMRELAATRAALSRLQREAAHLRKRIDAFPV